MNKIELYNNGKLDYGKVVCAVCNVLTTYTEYLDREGGYLKKRVCDACGNTYKYPKDAGKDNLGHRVYYKEKCKSCKKYNACLTQPDHNPEYYTTVGIACWYCEKWVWFKLPVN